MGGGGGKEMGVAAAAESCLCHLREKNKKTRSYVKC
jgi:hypothetical protein